MVRPLRLNLAGGWYQVFHRATDRVVLFRDARDRDHFLELLAESIERYRVAIHAYVLMANTLLAMAHRDPGTREKPYRREAQEKLTHGAEVTTLERLLDRVGIGQETFFKHIKALAHGGCRETQNKRHRTRLVGPFSGHSAVLPAV